MKDTENMESQDKTDHIDLSLSAVWAKRAEALSALYPPLPDDYFDGKDMDEILKRKSDNPIDKAINAYNELPVKPYIRRRNLNADQEGPEKTAWEIGISFDF